MAPALSSQFHDGSLTGSNQPKYASPWSEVLLTHPCLTSFLSTLSASSIQPPFSTDPPDSPWIFPLLLLLVNAPPLPPEGRFTFENVGKSWATEDVNA